MSSLSDTHTLRLESRASATFSFFLTRIPTMSRHRLRKQLTAPPVSPLLSVTPPVLPQIAANKRGQRDGEEGMGGEREGEGEW